MATFLLDLDGTTLTWGKNEFLEGALTSIKKINALNHELVFITQRVWDDETYGPEMNLHRTVELFKKHDIKYHSIISGCTSPRFIYNDSGCTSFNCIQNAPLHINPDLNYYEE